MDGTRTGGSNHYHRQEEQEDAGDLMMMPESPDYPPPPPGLLRRGGGAPATATATHRRQIHAIPAPFMSFRPPTAANTPIIMPHHHHHQGRHGSFNGPASPHIAPHAGSRRPPFQQKPPGSDPNAATLQRFNAITAAVSRSAVGVYAPRRIWNPNSTLMTMFYNGAVNVFDVPMDKAREIMVLAGRASVPSPPSAAAVVQKSDSTVFLNNNTTRFAVPGPRKIVVQKPQGTISPHVSVISSPAPGASSQAPMLSKSSPPVYKYYTPAPTTSSAVPPINQASSAQPMQQASTAAAAAVEPIAVRQSRKASLARFLERRKERVSNVSPYPLSKNPPESIGNFGRVSTPSKLSHADIAPPSNNCQDSMSLDRYNGSSLAMSNRVIIELE